MQVNATHESSMGICYLYSKGWGKWARMKTRMSEMELRSKKKRNRLKRSS